VLNPESFSAHLSIKFQFAVGGECQRFYRMTLRVCLAVILVVIQAHVKTSAQVKPKAAKMTNSSISGSVTVESKPRGGVIVILQSLVASAGEESIKTKTNQDGSFRISGLAEGKYFITVLATAFVLESSGNDYLSGKVISIDENENVENMELKLVRGGVITGQVTDNDGNPVIEATMSLEQLPEPNQRRPLIPLQVGPFLTDDRGQYRFYGIPEGKYKISVLQQIGVARLRTYYPAIKDGSQAKVVEVNLGSEVKNIDVKVQSESKTYEARGRVIDESGQPLPDILLGYYRTEAGMGAKGNHIETSGSIVNVDARGEFRLVGLLPGQYTLYAQANSSQQPNWYSEPAIVNVSTAHINGIEVKAQRGGSISGVLLVENGVDDDLKTLLGKLRVVASLSPEAGLRGMNHQLSGKVDSSGAFKITGIGPGKVTIGFDSRTVKELALQRIELSGRDLVSGFSIGAGEHITNVRMLLSYGTGVVKGEVQVQGGEFAELSGLSVACRRTGNPLHRPLRVPVDVRGRFVIENLPPGEYTISVNGQPIQRSAATLFPRASQQVSIVNGVETPITLVINLRPNSQ
jgi:protocatechuate 3,4-dioxygenase beta subunit